MVDTKAERDEPNEFDLKGFVNIRTRLFEICHALDVDKAPSLRMEERKPVLAHFFRIEWPKFSTREARRWRLRAEVYKLLKTFIFDDPCFGLCGEMERQLVYLEQVLGKNERGWRSRS